MVAGEPLTRRAPSTEPTAISLLLGGHWYDAVASLLDVSLVESNGHHRTAVVPGTPETLVEARALATAARRVLDLDAEDFSTIASGFSTPWAKRLADSSFPLEPRDPVRGALGSLIPLYELMLEVLEIRAMRRESLQIVVTAHLIGEYFAQLAWQSVLGHAGDPERLGDSVAGSRWGTDDPLCPHSSALRSTAKRALNACSGDTAGYTAYLDRFHSRQGDALAVCAMNHATIGAGERPDVGDTCPNPCGFVTSPSMAERRDLDARVRLALLYVDSPIVALRHHAPVGHFFGVPSVQEISDAWIRTWERVSQPWPDGSNPLLTAGHPDRSAPNEALPGMSALVSAVAGQPIGPGHLVRDIGSDIARLLDPAHTVEVAS
jgi:hypothetical protein